jgi:hypothetical protein
MGDLCPPVIHRDVGAGSENEIARLQIRETLVLRIFRRIGHQVEFRMPPHPEKLAGRGSRRIESNLVEDVIHRPRAIEAAVLRAVPAVEIGHPLHLHRSGERGGNHFPARFLQVAEATEIPGRDDSGLFRRANGKGSKEQENDFTALITGGKLLEKDGRGPKVYMTSDGRIVKLFRVKRRISSNLLQAYARRFAGNAAALARAGVEAPTVEFFGKVPHIARQIVIYPMMPGVSLREALRGADHTAAEDLMRRFGSFLAELHGKGVLFRSVHFGNVLVDGDGMSLIDILDLKIFPKPLAEQKRTKNIRFLVKYPEDRAMVRIHLDALREGYGSVFPGGPQLFSELEHLASDPDGSC